MELQIQDLVSSIKKEGFEAAQAEAESILAKAKAEAETIVSKAKADAKKALESSQKEIGLMKESAQLSAKQAQRDAVLSFRNEIQSEIGKILSEEVKKALSEDVLVKLINAAMAGEDPAAYAVEIADASEALKSKLAEKIKAGLEVRVSKNAASGFRLCAKDGSGYIDCSEEELTNMLMPFFSNLNI